MDREWISRRIYSTDRGQNNGLLLVILVLCLPAVYGADKFTVSPGETVTLPCDGGTNKNTSEVKKEWIFRGMIVVSFQNRTLCKHKDFLNRTQLESIQENNFSLVISHVGVHDDGGFKCLFNGAVMQRYRLFVPGGRKRRAAEIPPEESDSLVCKLYEDKDKDKEVPDENPLGATSSVWLTVGLPVIVVILGIVVLLLWFFKRRRNQPKTQMRTEPTPNPEGRQTDYEMVPCTPPQ